MRSFLHDLLVGVARVGAKAGARAMESVLEDVDAVATDVSKRTKKARSRIKVKPVEVEVQDDEEDE